MKYLIVFAIMLFGSCTSTKNYVTEAKYNAGPRIVFLNYKISQDSNGNVQASLVNKIIAEGKLKSETPEDDSPETGDLKCTQLDDKSVPLQSITISNPLFKDIEYADDSGKLVMKRIELDSTEFPVRMQLNPRAKFVSLEQVNATNKPLTNDTL